MAVRSDPYQRLRLRAWDQTRSLSARGADPAGIAATVSSALASDIDQVARVVVPAHGRSFWVSLSKSLVWGLAVVALLLAFGPGGSALPLLRPALVAVVLLWAVTFGVFAANHKVRVDRARATATARAVIGRTVDQATDAGAADRLWSARLRARPGEVDGFVVDGSLRAVQQAAAGSGPVVLFVRMPGTFADPAREAADRCGIGLFVLGGPDLVPMSALASAALDAADPSAVLRRGWSAAAAARAAATARRGPTDGRPAPPAG